MDYKEQIKHPKWQKKRLEILERDNFQCQSCFDKEKQLHVHHLKYEKGKKIWGYENNKLITLCSSCHESLHYHIYNDFYDFNILYTVMGCNPIYIDIFRRRILSAGTYIGSDNAMKSVIQHLTEIIITKEDM